jgi:hypothetical protein
MRNNADAAGFQQASQRKPSPVKRLREIDRQLARNYISKKRGGPRNHLSCLRKINQKNQAFPDKQK